MFFLFLYSIIYAFCILSRHIKLSRKKTIVSLFQHWIRTLTYIYILCFLKKIPWPYRSHSFITHQTNFLQKAQLGMILSELITVVKLKSLIRTTSVFNIHSCKLTLFRIIVKSMVIFVVLNGSCLMIVWELRVWNTSWN